jgi:hypothetical protein
MERTFYVNLRTSWKGIGTDNHIDPVELSDVTTSCRGKYILRSSVSPQILLDWTTLDLLVTIKLKQQTFDIIFPSLERNSCMTVTRRTDSTIIVLGECRYEMIRIMNRLTENKTKMYV